MFNKIEDGIRDIKAGKMVVVVDDENRENEGDLVMASELATYDAVNFMTKEARGLICVTITKERSKKLNLRQMVDKNTDSHGTAFTVSVDHIKTSTGISIADRLKTILALGSERVEEFKKPGHIFPLVAKEKGVLEREGHTEASVDLAMLAGLNPSGVICEILNEDGTMARLPELLEFAKKKDLKLISIKDLIKYRRKNTLRLVSEANMPTEFGNFLLKAYENDMDKKEHMAIVKGSVKGKEGVKVRIHSECFTGDILGSLRCDCGNQLKEAMKRIEKEGEGLIIYMRQEGRGIGIYNKLKAYELQDEGYDTVEANLHLGFDSDLRDYYLASAIIKDLGIKSIKLMTNNPSKINGLRKYGVEVEEREGIYTKLNSKNKKYFETKIEKMEHFSR